VAVRLRRPRAARRPRRRCSASATRLAISSGATRWGICVKGAPQVGSPGGAGGGAGDAWVHRRGRSGTARKALRI